MQTVIVVTWNTEGNLDGIFGVYTSYEEIEKAVNNTAALIHTTPERLRLDLDINSIQLNQNGVC